MSGDDFARRTKVHMARMDALNAAAATERGKRNVVNFATYFVAIGVLISQWSSLDIRIFLLVLVGLVVVRIVGNAFVTSWCNAEIARIKAALPLESAENGGADGLPPRE